MDGWWPPAPFPRARTVTFFAAPNAGASLVPGRRDGRALPWCCGGGCLGLKDEAALQFRSGHGTRKRNVSSRHPANRRRCNPPLGFPRVTRESGSLVLIGFWFFCLLMFASRRMLPSRGLESGHWEKGRVVCAQRSLPRHLTLKFAAPHCISCCPTAGQSFFRVLTFPSVLLSRALQDA